MTKTRGNYIRKYKDSLCALYVESGAIAAGSAIFAFNLSYAAEELRPKDIDFETAKTEFLEAKEEECQKAIEDTDNQDYSCFVSAQDIQANYTEIQADTAGKLDAYEKNIEPYADIGVAGLALTFVAVATIGILKPRFQDTFALRKKIPDVPPLKVFGIEINY